MECRGVDGDDSCAAAGRGSAAAGMLGAGFVGVVGAAGVAPSIGTPGVFAVPGTGVGVDF